MRYTDAAIPLGLAWSSPFARWQGSLSEVSSLDVAVAVTSRALADRGVDPAEFDGLVLGWTVPQPEVFYGAPTVAARIGATGVSGPMVSQACATSVAALHAAAAAVAAGAGTQAAEMGTNRSEIDELTALRWEQYTAALADDRAFQRRYLVPVVLPRKRGELRLDADEGVRPKGLETITKLSAATPDCVHTFASQTHPADGSAGAVVTTTDHARELSGGEGVARILAIGFARVGTSRMPQAPVPAARSALRAAGKEIGDVDAVTTHNPFAVNDLYFAAETGFAIDRMNTYGCSLVFGHPQGPTGLRSIAELIETLRVRGGGIGLFTGCAAGDTGAALVLEVTDR